MNRYLVQRIGFVLLVLVTLVVVVPILLVIGVIVVRGIEAISWEFLTGMPRDGMKAGGIFPAIVGTLLLILTLLTQAAGSCTGDTCPDGTTSQYQCDHDRAVCWVVCVDQ